MSDSRSDPSPGDAGEGPEEGILGNLPRSRPTVRSPRRAEQELPDPPPGGDEQREPPVAASTGGGSDVEALARAGLMLASGAASLGLRAAGRALAAARDAVERR